MFAERLKNGVTRDLRGLAAGGPEGVRPRGVKGLSYYFVFPSDAMCSINFNVDHSKIFPERRRKPREAKNKKETYSMHEV